MAALPVSLHSFWMRLSGSPLRCKLPRLLVLCSPTILLAALRCAGATPKGGAPGPSGGLPGAAAVSFSIALHAFVLEKTEPGSQHTLRQSTWLPSSLMMSSVCAQGPPVAT